jgi:hypothetical protein
MELKIYNNIGKFFEIFIKNNADFYFTLGCFFKINFYNNLLRNTCYNDLAMLSDTYVMNPFNSIYNIFSHIHILLYYNSGKIC